jgi:hypothetical protein
VSVQINQEMRNKLINDFKAISQRSAVDLSWERWLKGSDPYLRVTFDPATADEDRSTTFVTPTHPLARQAAKSLDSSATLSCSVSATSSTVTPGRYPFAIYRWKILGVKESFAFQPVCESEEHSRAILELLENAVTAEDATPMSAAEEDRLEAIHYRIWMSSRSEHIETVTRSAEIRLTSLKSSHQARVALLEEQCDQATDARIRRMKLGQIEAANRDFERRRSELEVVAGQAEIVAEVVVHGVLVVERPTG